MKIDQFLQKRHEMSLREIGMTRREKREFNVVKTLVASVVALGVIIFGISLTPPPGFDVEKNYAIESGSTLKDISQYLKDEKAIRSKQFFQLLAIATGTSSELKAGNYSFEKPLSSLEILRLVADGATQDNHVVLTIPEGSSLEYIGETAEALLNNFDADAFVNMAIVRNGYLFPSTYFLDPETSEQDLIDRMGDTFAGVLAEIALDTVSDYSPEELRDRVIMASIIEREAAGKDDAYLISGVLWKRIEIGMPLQVDASFAYLFDKESKEVTLSDLAYDSPYNTYKYTGLPPGPLGNPGRIALDAALFPADSPYLFYLHDPEGGVHFGQNLAEHNENKRLYLR